MSRTLIAGTAFMGTTVALLAQGCVSEVSPDTRETSQSIVLNNERFELKPLKAGYKYVRTWTEKDYGPPEGNDDRRRTPEEADAGLKAIQTMSRAELANAFRDVVLRPDGTEWEEIEPRWDIADIIIAERNRKEPERLTPTPGGGHTPGPVPELLEGHRLFGTDNRVRIRNNTAHPFRSIAKRVNSSCTSTLIGPSTALGAAHCYYGNGAYFANNAFEFGLDKGDTPDTPYAQEPCYDRHVPIEFRNGNEDANFDFAVVDFEPCNRFPGNTLGWIGMWATQDGHWSSFTALWLYGYPRELDAQGLSCPSGTNPLTCYWPTIWGSSSNWFGVRSSLQIKHQIDVSGGQSGSATYVIDGGDRYTVGVLTGSTYNAFEGGWFNYGRRVDSTLFAYIEANSDWQRDSASVKHPSL